jgi:hypothetical protein
VYSYRILPEQGLIVISVRGTTTADEIIRLSGDMRADPAFSTDYDAVVDNSGLEHPPTGEELRTLADPRSIVANPDTRLAVIAPADAVYGTSRMHQTLAESRNPVQIQVFRDRGAALRWLGKEDVGIEALLDEMRAA